jgi:hypothetical protein
MQAIFWKALAVALKWGGFRSHTTEKARNCPVIRAPITKSNMATISGAGKGTKQMREDRTVQATALNNMHLRYPLKIFNTP